jgi:Fur family ferric uptake transcriptional regulator
MAELSLEERLHQAGYKYTTPRRLVAEVLESHNAHLTANEIWEAVQSLDSTIGRMSVYRTLELFTQVGYIRPASQSASEARNGLVYVLMHNGHHHHIVCRRCNQVIEFDDCGLEGLIQRLQEKYGCQIEGHLLEFFGLCFTCR